MEYLLQQDYFEEVCIASYLTLDEKIEMLKIIIDKIK